MENKSEKTDALKVSKEVAEELVKYRKPFEKDWNDYDDAYYGKQHKTGENKKTVKNKIFQIIETEVPVLTDSMPGTQLIASSEDRQGDADNLEKAIRYVYQHQNLTLMLPNLVRSGLTSAPGYLYAYSDVDSDYGDGQIKYKKLPWNDVWLDGNASNLEDSACARIRIPMRRGEVYRIWPEHKEALEDISGKETEKSGDDGNFEKRDVSGSDGGATGKPKRFTSKDVLNYYETWVKSYDLKDIDPEATQEDIAKERGQISNNEPPEIRKWEDHDAHSQDHLAQRAELLAQVQLPPETTFDQAKEAIDQIIAQMPEAKDQLFAGLIQLKIIDNHLEEHAELKKLNPSSQEPKYKNNWRVIRNVCDVVLYDGEAPDGLDTIPVVPFYGYKDDTIYGFGEVKNIIDAQRCLNEMDNKELRGLRRVTNPGWVVDHEAQVDEKNLTDEEGIVIKKAKGTEVSRLEPGQVSPQLEYRKQYEMNAINEISGIREETQGKMPSPNASGVTIEKLQTQAVGRIRLKDRYLQGYSMKRLATITAKLIIATWSTEKRMRLSSNDGKIEDSIFDPIKVQDLEYTIEVAPGSMAGVDKEALNAFMYNLLNQKHITFKDFLQVAQFPKKEMLLKSLSEREGIESQVAKLEQDTIAQGQQYQQQLLALQKENIQLRSKISPDLLSNDERSIAEQSMRDDALKELAGSSVLSDMQQQPVNNAPNNGQAMNQGNM